MQELPDRLVIENRGVGAIYEKQFFLDIEKAILEGYRLAKNDSMKDVTMRNFRGFLGRAVFYKVGTEDFLVNNKKKNKPETKVIKDKPIVEDIPTISTASETKEEPIKEEYSEITLNAYTKKKDILEYATLCGVEISDTTLTAQQLKKVIKETYK